MELEKKSFQKKIDLNCDLGQSWGIYNLRDEESLLPYVTSVNIACGGHAGDGKSMLKALKIARDLKLNVGAHIGYPDLAGFGRREMRLDNDDLQATLHGQIGALEGMARSLNLSLTHVRPHGAMYHRIFIDAAFAETLARIVLSYSPWLILVGPSCPHFEAAGNATGLSIAPELHLDKQYRRDGQLNKLGQGRPLSYDFVQQQAASLFSTGKIITEGGKRLRLGFRTVHLSMERNYALELASSLSSLLEQKPTPINSMTGIQNIEPLELRERLSLTTPYV